MNVFTPTQLAQRWGVKKQHVHNLILAGHLPAFNAGRSAKKPRWRIREDSVEYFELTRTPEQTPPKPRRRKRPTNYREWV